MTLGLRIVPFVLLTAILSGCVTITPAVAPTANSSAVVKANISPRLPALEEKWASRSEIPNSYFGVVTPASGSLALGVLLGPLGILANTAYTQAANDSKAGGLNSYATLNLADMMRESDPALRITKEPVVGEYTLLPAARIQFLDDKSYVLACVLNVEYTAADKSQWKMRYDMNPGGELTVGMSGEAALIATHTRDCLDRAKALFMAHASGKLGTPVPKTVKLKDMTVTMPVYVEYWPKRLVNNQGVVVQELRRSIVLSVE